MARKRKTLPRDFDALLAAGDMNALIAVFDMCELYARGGDDKSTAIAFATCPDELTRWLAARGLDVDTPDDAGRTPLWQRARRGQDPALLIELGADVNARDRYGKSALHAAIGHPAIARRLLDCGAAPNTTDSSGRTPLHDAVGLNAETVQILIDHDANTAAQDFRDRTPIHAALEDCQNFEIATTARSVKTLLTSGAVAPPNAAELVERIGEQFEFYRDSFNPDYLDDTDKALAELYAMLGATPAPRRRRHDGTSPITMGQAPWREQFHDLWDYLVPANGRADTIQGEVIRIAGNLAREVLHNGGSNWSARHRAMLNELTTHLGTATPAAEPDELIALRRSMPKGHAEAATVDRLCQLAVAWVAANPQPVAADPAAPGSPM
ncbi:ankyrin repeat domain-containing protein [Mycolicibacterium smegmatis]|uniref:ankyrin repeat domain-containing protein n=1 Tax=Mycolicibacterium smegmatis TaxID=1772 RepID=UPI0020A2DA42|nr:ankyrin repeat domain-containing protein [Mycolicibacterium smegmatis]MCP2626074.1 ankyrin repeat domain-containing protein [Mycolicibacterium smegmatis]